jgi:hypothetical protein
MHLEPLGTLVDPSLIDHGLLFGLADDDHLQYLLLAGRAGGQIAFGGTLATETLQLRGSTNADLGLIDCAGPMVFTGNFLAASPQLAMIEHQAIVPSTGGAVAGLILNAPELHIDNSLFIWYALSDTGFYYQEVAAGFAVQTLFLAQPRYVANTAGIAPPNAFTFAAQAIMRGEGCGIVTTGSHLGMTFAPQLQPTVSGDNMTVTDHIGISVAPIWSTVVGTTANFGRLTGMKIAQPVRGLFQPTGGVETMTEVRGLDFLNMTFAGGIPRSVIYNQMVGGLNNRLIRNVGGAESDFGTGSIHLNDNSYVKLGNTVASPDVIIGWASAESKLVFSSFFGTGGAPLYLQGTAADEWIFSQHSLGTIDIGVGFNVNAIVFGTTLPTPNSNNWFVQFAAPSGRQVQIGGEYSDVLWTAGGFIDVDGQAVSDLQAFKINSPAILLNGGSIQDISNLFVSAMPSFGAPRTQALRVLGRARIDGVMNNGSREPAQITANQNDYQLGQNNNQRAVNLLDTDDDYNITGIDSSFGFAQTGDRIYIYNNGAFDITLTHQDAASLAANRFICPESLPYVIHPQRGIWLWYDDTGTARWRVLATMGHLGRTLHLSGDQFRKGATAPTDVTIGTTPTVPALLFDATNELASLYHSLPADADLTQDVILRLQFSLAQIETNGDTCDFTCDYTAVTLLTGEGVAKASTQITGQFTAVTGRLAVGDIYEMDITFIAGDATNPLATARGLAFEIHLTNTTGVAAIDLLDGDLIYTALRS